MRKYNFIFRRLVDNDTDLVGLLAYSIYKKEKIEYIEKYVRDNGHDPSEDELNTFHQFTQSDAHLQQYLTTAEGNISGFVDNLMQAKADQVETFYRSAYKETVKESGHGYWYGVFQGVVSSFAYTLLLGLLVFFLWAKDIGPKEIIEKVFNVHIVPGSPKNTAQ